MVQFGGILPLSALSFMAALNAGAEVAKHNPK